jgi:hypothetical protein
VAKLTNEHYQPLAVRVLEFGSCRIIHLADTDGLRRAERREARRRTGEEDDLTARREAGSSGVGHGRIFAQCECRSLEAAAHSGTATPGTAEGAMTRLWLLLDVPAFGCLEKDARRVLSC